MKLAPRSTSDLFFFDAESTGIPHFKLQSDDPSQPHLVEIAGLRYSPNAELVGGMCLLVKPEGWAIPDAVIAVHGITNEMATEQGSPEVFALAAFSALYDGCALRVAHNRAFDDRIIRIALKRYAGEEHAQAWKDQPGECTAQLSRPLCQLPATEKMKATNFKNSFKTPTLAEAFTHLTGGKEMVGAHRAMPDAQACARIYFLMKGIRMPEFPDDADALREGRGLPHGKDECDAVQLALVDGEK